MTESCCVADLRDEMMLSELTLFLVINSSVSCLKCLDNSDQYDWDSSYEVFKPYNELKTKNCSVCDGSCKIQRTINPDLRDFYGHEELWWQARISIIIIGCDSSSRSSNVHKFFCMSHLLQLYLY